MYVILSPGTWRKFKMALRYGFTEFELIALILSVFCAEIRGTWHDFRIRARCKMGFFIFIMVLVVNNSNCSLNHVSKFMVSYSNILTGRYTVGNMYSNLVAVKKSKV